MKHCHFTILYNEIDFLRLKMPFLYEHFDQLIFYDLSAFGNERKFSDDGSHEFIKNYPDPDNKITLIEETDLSGVTPLGAGNEIKCKMFSYGSKFVRDDMDVFWCTDIDEFFKKELIEEVETIFKRSVNSIGTKFYNFYKTPEFLLTYDKSLTVNPSENCSIRIARHKSGNKYGHCDIAKNYKPINLTTKNAIYHLPWVGQKRVREKFSYYKDNPVTGFVSVKYIKEWEEFSEAKFNALNKKGFYGNPFVGPGRFDRTQVTKCPFDLFEELPYLNSLIDNSEPKFEIKNTEVKEEVKITEPVEYDISFIIPLRKREDQIEGLEYNIEKYFSDYNYEIIYVVQNDDKLFKRGQLCNIGFKESRGKIIIFQDIDIRHLRKINVQDLLKKFNGPFVAFDKITQIYEKELGEYEKIITEERTSGWGACAVFTKDQFIKSGGFSNLIFGWGAEDNIMNERAKFKRYVQDLGHVYHDPLRSDKIIHQSQYYRNNQNVWKINKNLSGQKDGFEQTIFNRISKLQKSDNITILNVSGIKVTDDYQYINLYNIYAKEDIKKEEIIEDIKEVKENADSRNKIKILLLPDRPQWAFENIANAIIKYNPYSEIEYTKQFIRSETTTYNRSEFIKNLFKYDDWDYVYVFFEDERSVSHNSKKLIKGCYSSLWLETTRITKQSLGESFRTCRGIIFANDRLKSLLTPHCADIDNTVINDAADPNTFYPTNEPKFEEFTVLFVGNIEREIKRFNIIKEICETANVKLLVARDIPHNELYKLYNKVHLCINFSISEGGPQTLFEAALCGTPMLINSEITMSEKVPCFRASSKEEMIKKLLYLKNNIKEVFKKGEEARKIVLENYTYNVVSKKFGDFFLKIANKDNKINDVTAFVITFGNSPNYKDCIDALNKQTFPCKIEIIKDYAPSSVAFQEMLNRCQTKYYIQVDDDMILNPDAVEIMYNAITSADEKTAIVTHMLHDVHLDFDIVGIKIFKHDITKNYPYNIDPTCSEIPTMNQIKRLEMAGYTWNMEKNVIGKHSPKWTNELIFERYFDLMDKYKMYGYVWLKDLPQKLEKMYKKNPSDLNYYAMMGAKLSSESKEIRNRQKDYRIKDENFLKIKLRNGKL